MTSIPTTFPKASDEPASPGGCADDVCNYLLLGSDSRQGLSQEEQTEFGTDQQIGGENRADTIMLVHTDPKLEKAIIVSFPRDLYVEIPGHGEDKINAAFEGGVEGGGPTLVANTVQQLTGLKIDHFLYVDLAGFQGVIETLDGVDMCITGENVNTPGYVESETADGTISEVYYNEPGHIVDPRTGLDVKPGCQRLPSDQALAYVRTRHLKCDSAAPDFYRIQRQQQFLRAVINRLLQPEQLAQLPLMIKPILSNLRRDEGLNPAELAYPHWPVARDLVGRGGVPDGPRLPRSRRISGSCGWISRPSGSSPRSGRARHWERSARTRCTRRRRKPPCRSWWSITRPAAR